MNNTIAIHTNGNRPLVAVEELRRDPAEEAAADFLTALGADLDDESLRDTPRRMARLYTELLTPAPFNATVNLYMQLPGVKQEVTVKATVRWMEPDGMGVQFGLMGARETHALTQLLTGAPPSMPP